MQATVKIYKPFLHLFRKLIFPPSRKSLRFFLSFNQILFKFLFDLIRDPEKTFWMMMEQVAEFIEFIEKPGDEIDQVSQDFRTFFQEMQPVLENQLIPNFFISETEKWIGATLEKGSALVYTKINKRIQRVLEGRNKPLFAPIIVTQPRTELIEYLKSGDAANAIECIESTPSQHISFQHVSDLISEGSALVYLLATDDGTFGIVTQKDVPPEIVLCKSFTRQKVKNLLGGWIWLYYWHREMVYARAIERSIHRRKRSQEEIEGLREAYQRIPYELLFHNQALFDHLQPTEIPANNGIPAIPFPSWLLIEAILRELGKGDLASNEGLWQRLDEKLYPRGVKRIILCPDKAFALFPHHGAILNIDRDGQKEYLLDRYEITYLPQGTLAKVKPFKPQPPHLLAFGTEGEEFLSVGLANLHALAPDCVSEWHASEKLDRAENNKRFKAKASEANALIFLGHGSHDWKDSSRSFLGLRMDRSGKGFNRWVTLKNFVKLIPPHINLVTLAGCGTGLPPITSLSDYKGFAEELLLRCGVSAVISTFWPIPRTPTVLLIHQFHKYWLLGNGETGSTKLLAPTTALRRAQLWLRALTREQAIAELETLASVQSSLEFAEEIQALQASSVEYPYAHPYFWSAFYMTGDI